MNTKIKTVLEIILLVVFIGAAYFAYTTLSNNYRPDNNLMPSKNSTNQTENDKTGQKESDTTEKQEEEKIAAPNFTVYDMEGNEVKLSDYTGKKPIILNFWASWCPYCVEEMPYFEESYKTYGDEIEFFMIDCVDGSRETKEKGQKFIKENKYTFPVYFDTENSAIPAYEASSLPTSVFIDKDGNVIAYQTGRLTKEMLQKGIDLIK